MKDHILHHDLIRILHPHSHHPQTITNENDIHPRGIGNLCTGEIMRREHGDGLVLPIHTPDCIDCDLFPRHLRRSCRVEWW